MLNITSYCLEQNWQQNPDKNALIFVPEIGPEITLTYHDLYTAIAKLTQGFLSLDMPPQTCITLHSAKTIDFILVFFAAMAAGFVPIPALSAVTQTQIDYIIENSHSLLIYEPDRMEHNLSNGAKCTLLRTDILSELKNFPFNKLPALTKDEDPAFMLYTSGSSAKPKAVLHAHRVILGREPLRKHWLDLDDNTILLHTGKPCWTYSMGVGLMDTWVKQGTAIMYAGDEAPGNWFDFLEKYKVTHFASSPAVFKSLLQIKNPKKYKLDALRIVASAGEILPEICKQYWMQHFSLPIYESLGMTEISTFISTGPSVPIKPGAIGKPQPGRLIRVVAIDGNEHALVPNEIGLLAIHRDNPGFMLGYQFNRRDHSDYYRGDWFLSGDLVSQDEDGYVYHHGRADKVIIRHGHRISSVEIENILIEFNAIYNVACMGKTNDHSTQLVIFIELKDSVLLSADTIRGLQDFIKDHLAPNQWPDKLVFIDRLPRTHTGKIDRNSLFDLIPLKTVVGKYE